MRVLSPLFSKLSFTPPVTICSPWVEQRLHCTIHRRRRSPCAPAVPCIPSDALPRGPIMILPPTTLLPPARLSGCKNPLCTVVADHNKKTRSHACFVFAEGCCGARRVGQSRRLRGAPRVFRAGADAERDTAVPACPQGTLASKQPQRQPPVFPTCGTRVLVDKSHSSQDFRCCGEGFQLTARKQGPGHFRYGGGDVESLSERRPQMTGVDKAARRGLSDGHGFTWSEGRWFCVHDSRFWISVACLKCHFLRGAHNAVG